MNIKLQRLSYLFLLLSFAVSISTYAQNGSSADATSAGFDSDGLENYENYLEKEIAAGRIPGAVSLISRKGHIAHSGAFGYNNMSTKAPMTKDKIFYIQSMTKPIISVAFMTLYEEGHFFLTDPVAKYLPQFADMKVMELGKDENGEITVDYVPLERPIEIWHLLSHTAGLSHGLGDNDYDKKLASLLYGSLGGEETVNHKTIEDRVNALVSYPLMGQPGKQWNYSASPDVLALLIEHFSGQTAAEFLQERIFDPLGMDDTGYNVSDENMSRLVGLHQMQEDGSLAYVEPWGPVQGNTIYGGTHGLFSSALIICSSA
jgi:CubicO group peptidase (beta-lactamase class C family)